MTKEQLKRIRDRAAGVALGDGTALDKALARDVLELCVNLETALVEIDIRADRETALALKLHLAEGRAAP